MPVQPGHSTGRASGRPLLQFLVNKKHIAKLFWEIKMHNKIILPAIFLVISYDVYAADLTGLICTQPQMREATLTQICKENNISAATICQGNEGKAWCKGVNLDIGETSILRVSIGFRNRHVPGHIWNVFKGRREPLVLYDSSSTGNVTIWIDKTCRVIDKRIEFSNASAQILQWLAEKLGKKVEDLIPNNIPGC